MTLARAIEFENLPNIRVGEFFKTDTVTKIEVYDLEYSDHTELTIIVYNGNNQLGKIWNVPCLITYLKEATK